VPSPRRTGFYGKDIDAKRASDIGLVNSLHGESAEEVYAAALALANEIAANSPSPYKERRLFSRHEGRTVDEGLDFVARWNTMYLASNDLREAMTAFLERRPPVFRGD